MDWFMYSLTNYWWIYLIIHVICCGVGYGMFHNVDTGLIAMDRLFLMFGIVTMLALILQILLILIWQIIKLPYYLGVYLSDKIKVVD